MTKEIFRLMKCVMKADEVEINLQLVQNLVYNFY